MRSRLLQGTIIFISAILLLELSLQIQQLFGGIIIDLNFRHITYNSLSDTLNHKPLPKQVYTLADKSIYEKHAGFRYTQLYNEDGIRINKQRPSIQPGNHRILFTGDSFIQGYDDNNTVPQHVLKLFHKKNAHIDVLNAACASYSPAIFIPQAKKLLPIYKPDLIVVDIDETDLGDDYLRYRNLTTRNSINENIGVRRSPIAQEHLAGYIQLRNFPLLSVRLARKIYHNRIHMPAYIEQYGHVDTSNVLAYSASTDPDYKKTFSREIENFTSNLNELSETLIKLMGKADRIIYVYHPHLNKIKPDNNGHYWNNIVSDSIMESARKHGISFFDATTHLTQEFSGSPESYYWKNDMHFNFKGLKAYAEYIANKLEGKLAETHENTHQPLYKDKSLSLSGVPTSFHIPR